MCRLFTYTLFYLLALAADGAETDSLHTDTLNGKELDEVTVLKTRPTTFRLHGAENGVTISRQELFRAACCNLGESFTTNPSVDVSYSDAATGAKQIRLLGLSGQYVQLLTENIPAFRGVAAPYSLGYIPGPWMQSIQVSKGASSVKNGYESITGQINVEYLKPQADEAVRANIYDNNMGKLEANADANVLLNPSATEGQGQWSMGAMLHYENRYHDSDLNHDGFIDSPNVRQWNGQFRWACFSPQNIFQGGVRLLKEERQSGQSPHIQATNGLYRIALDTRRYEAFAKNAYILNSEHNTNVALMLTASLHELDTYYGRDNWKAYDARQRNLYAGKR